MKSFALWFIFNCSLLFLTGCTTTKYVSAPCPKPPQITVPYDYLGQLNSNSGPTDFVKASLATRASGFQAFDSCNRVLNTYR